MTRILVRVVVNGPGLAGSELQRDPRSVNRPRPLSAPLVGDGCLVVGVAASGGFTSSQLVWLSSKTLDSPPIKGLWSADETE